ncbi:FadR/GntR family transcriptional regulator [Aureimonas frigidaquae]|uniref:Transcriptional regulator n=1 Tax=Aureimonas frigidaquae TaxID=424757 RepID=A0A0P0Z1Q7_9HYPH|nr:FadR/GntR family transcriptional regulator [Aureimonas frigidaquae]BAT27859.1 transcriptional regulator [Aureimonas frigidaquae]
MSIHSPAAEPRRLYQQIADQIRDLIAERALETGGRLPPERDLAQQLGVSRPSLREALIALEIEGTVEIRMGSGIYYLGAAASRTRPHGDSPIEIMEARIAIETAAIPLACARSDSAGIARLDAILAAMSRDIAEGRSPLDNDRLFHMEITGLSGNAVMTRLVGELFEARFSPLSAQFREHFDSHQGWRAAYDEHARIVEALRSRDSLRASGELAAHLLTSLRRWEQEA